MTKREVELLSRGINPLTGGPINHRPRVARAVAAAPWLSDARAVISDPTAAEQHTTQAALADRPWTFAGIGVSKSGRDTVVCSAPMVNGGTFQTTMPGDLVRALIGGKVAGLPSAS